MAAGLHTSLHYWHNFTSTGLYSISREHSTVYDRTNATGMHPLYVTAHNLQLMYCSANTAD
jgi:hypothetical protein